MTIALGEKIMVSSMEELRTRRSAWIHSVGFVPTMGFLHEGHLSLVRRARAENAHVVASIFVNPAQFGPNEDFERYPRNLKRDLELLEGAGVDMVWAPPVDEIYPSGFETYVNPGALAETLEGAARPGHFKGVATVVAKLFNAVNPFRAYFGQKDAQQVAVIKRMSRDLNFSTEIVLCQTIREADGLALSSRNSYLKTSERKAAPVLYQALNRAREAYENGERSAEALRVLIAKTIEAESAASLQYASVANPETLRELSTVDNNALFSLAVKLGTTRLIDNFLLERGIWFTGEGVR